MLFDAHLHLDQFPDSSVVGVLDNAKKAGVEFVFANSVDLSSSKRNLDLAKKFSSVKPFIGLHPADVLKMNSQKIKETLKFVEMNAEKAFGIGEIGLDYKYAEKKEQQELQKNVFESQLEIAEKYSKPVNVHSRFVKKEVFDVLSKFKLKKILHWFFPSESQVEDIEKQGIYCSIGPSVFSLPEFLKKTDLLKPEKTLFETDAPVHYGGMESEPSWIKKVALTYSNHSSIPIEKIKGLQVKALGYFER